MLLRVVENQIIFIQPNAELIDKDGEHWSYDKIRELSEEELIERFSIYKTDPIIIPSHMELDSEVKYEINHLGEPFATYTLKEKPMEKRSSGISLLETHGIEPTPEIIESIKVLTHTDANISNLVAFGGIVFRTLTLHKKGDFHQGHRHNYDHITNVIKGPILCEVENGTPKLYNTGDQITIKKDDWHKFTAVEDGVMYQCVYRQPDDEMEDAYQPHNSPYGLAPFTAEELVTKIANMKNPCAHCDCGKNQYPFILREALTLSDIETVLKLVNDNADQFQPNSFGPYRNYWMYGKENTFNELIDIKTRVAKHFELTEWSIDPFFYDIIGHITEGGFIHQHTDPVISSDYEHIRINIFISKPETGGDPIVDGKLIEGLSVGDAWMNFASIAKHGITTVNGDTPRIVISLGFQVPKQIADSMIDKYRSWLL